MAAITIWRNTEDDIALCENLFWINGLISFCLITQLIFLTTNVVNNPKSLTLNTILNTLLDYLFLKQEMQMVD